MEAQRVAEGSDIRSSLRTALSVSSTLAARWDELSAEGRLRLTKRLAQVAGWLSDSIAGENAPGTTDERMDDVFDRFSYLTPREFEVVLALAAGRSTAEIAESLGIARQTVRSHVKAILAKLGAHSRVEVVSMYLAELDRPWR